MCIKLFRGTRRTTTRLCVCAAGGYGGWLDVNQNEVCSHRPPHKGTPPGEQHAERIGRLKCAPLRSNITPHTRRLKTHSTSHALSLSLSVPLPLNEYPSAVATSMRYVHTVRRPAEPGAPDLPTIENLTHSRRRSNTYSVSMFNNDFACVIAIMGSIYASLIHVPQAHTHTHPHTHTHMHAGC